MLVCVFFSSSEVSFDNEENMFVAVDVDRELQCAMMFPATFRRNEIIYNRMGVYCGNDCFIRQYKLIH